MNEDSTRNGGPLSFADTLSPLERAALGLQADLSIFELVRLTYPDNAATAARNKLSAALLDAALAGALPVYGKPTGWPPLERCSWKYGESRFENPYQKTDSHESTARTFFTGGTVSAGEFTFAEHSRAWCGDACLVSHADYFAFLKTPLALGIPEPNWLAPAAESIPPETSLPEPARPASVAKGGIALVEAEDAALVALRKTLKREPDFEEFWDYLTTQDKTGTVADSNDVSLQWIGKSEQSCNTAKRTIRNRLTAAKKRNPFTPS